MIDLLILCLKPMMWTNFYVFRFSKAPVGEKVQIIFALLLLFFPTLIGILADIIVNNTTVPFVLGHEYFEEFTFSTRLERLCTLPADQVPDQQLYIQIALKINRVCPTHDHIQAVVGLQT